MKSRHQSPSSNGSQRALKTLVCSLMTCFLLFGFIQSSRAQNGFTKEASAKLTLIDYQQPSIRNVLPAGNLPSLRDDSGFELIKARHTGKHTWEFYKFFQHTKREVVDENSIDSTFALLQRNLPARHNYGTYAKVQMGYGKVFSEDTVGISRINGAGLDEPRYLYLQLIFKF